MKDARFYQLRDSAVRAICLSAIQRNGGKWALAAKALGLCRGEFYRQAKSVGLDPPMTGRGNRVAWGRFGL